MIRLIFVTVLFSLQMSACLCDFWDAKQLKKAADFVFVGKVLEVQYVDSQKQFKEPRTIVTVDVRSFYKGRLSKTVKVFSNVNYGSCSGFPFEVGQEVLVFAEWVSAKEWLERNGKISGKNLPKANERIMRDGVCSGTTFFSHLNEKDIKLLGKPKLP